MGASIKKVWWVADAVVSPLGQTTADNFTQVMAGRSGIALNQRLENSVYLSQISDLQLLPDHTRFESLGIHALRELKKQVVVPVRRTLFILSTTKGSIEALENGHPDHPRLSLHAAGQLLAKEAGIEKSIVISNACTSGVVAILVAKRYLESGAIDHAVVLGLDVLSDFIISGFQCLHASSAEPCKPFDLNRAGINLGEAAAAVLITAKPEEFERRMDVAILGGGVSNDANHISGPSKTGEELALAIQIALEEAKLQTGDIDFISAHGTATVYNDEMEAKAFDFLKLNETPLHSLKGNFGHTLGAAGVLETAMAVQGLTHHRLFPTYGFETLGVSKPMNISKKSALRMSTVALKTASGFGGCNAALVLSIKN